jgi:hypothetical protein
MKHPLHCAVFVLLCLCPAVRAQDIRFRALDGRNGHPVMNVHIGVAAALNSGGPKLVTNKNGEAILNPALDLGSGVASFFFVPDNYVDCRKLLKTLAPADVNPYPVHSVAQVRTSGVLSENRCSKKRFVAAPQPGEVVFFVRPIPWWAKLLFQFVKA